MKALRWEDVRDDWNRDLQCLVDVFNDGQLAEDDWQRLLDALHSSSWPLVWGHKENVPVPTTAGELFALVKDGAQQLEVELGEGVLGRCFFYGTAFSPADFPTLAECDFAKTSIRSQAHLDTFCAFVRLLGRATSKPVLIADEGGGDPWMRYEPVSDEFVRLEGEDAPSVAAQIAFWLVALLLVVGLGLAVYAVFR
jgi:hypothetical protein